MLTSLVVILAMMYLITATFAHWRGQEIDRLERELYQAELAQVSLARSNFEAGYTAGKESMRRTQAGGQ